MYGDMSAVHFSAEVQTPHFISYATASNKEFKRICHASVIA